MNDYAQDEDPDAYENGPLKSLFEAVRSYCSVNGDQLFAMLEGYGERCEQVARLHAEIFDMKETVANELREREALLLDNHRRTTGIIQYKLDLREAEIWESERAKAPKPSIDDIKASQTKDSVVQDLRSQLLAIVNPTLTDDILKDMRKRKATLAGAKVYLDDMAPAIITGRATMISNLKKLLDTETMKSPTVGDMKLTSYGGQ